MLVIPITESNIIDIVQILNKYFSVSYEELASIVGCRRMTLYRTIKAGKPLFKNEQRKQIAVMNLIKFVDSL